MYYNERVFIDTRRYEIGEILHRFHNNQIIFCDRQKKSYKTYTKMIQDIMGALTKGIPFPPVYVSELQNGQFLVLDKNDKLRVLLEYLSNGVHQEEYLISDIMYSQIIVYVIEYINPKYRHMQVGSFIEEWSVNQEQKIWNILYGREFADDWGQWLYAKTKIRGSIVSQQYYLIYFIMTIFIKNHILEKYNCEYCDKYQLLESTVDILKQMRYEQWDEYYEQFKKYYLTVENKIFDDRLKGVDEKRLRILSATEERMKYLCFIYLNDDLSDKLQKYRYDRVYRKELEKCIYKCDMSYRGIRETLNEIRWKL